ncbi:MAG: hypothetical protein M3290_13100, partial [Actinomycetota bacterium]|nr:hypothetical protein [Actinomycetota bacterium]
MSDRVIRPLSVGLDVGYDPSWPSGFMYVRSVATTLTAVPPEERPEVRLLPLDVETSDRLGDLADRAGLSLARPRGSATAVLLFRRIVRKLVQPYVGRALLGCYRGLDVTYPDWGRPLPGAVQIAWIPDLQHVHLPHLFSAEEIARRDARVARLARSRG